MHNYFLKWYKTVISGTETPIYYFDTNMESKKEIENLMNEELRRLSLNFELDLIRLSKTLSLTSHSKDIVEKYMDTLEVV